VTFRLFAPKADKVAVNGDFNGHKTLELGKEKSGLWTVTVGPLPPNLYEYTFLVGGRLVLDPRNDQIRPGNQPTSLLEVPGPKPMLWEPRDVPHGTVHVHWYASARLGKQRRLHVYTPPGYEEGRKSYPTLYLLHGSGGTDADWVVAGRVNFILDNLLAEGKVVPMVAVMPMGHPLRDAEASMAASAKGWTLERDLRENALPLVEKTYRVKTNPESRAIAGASMGGGQALDVAGRNLDRFAWVGSFSAGWTGLMLYHVESNPRQLNDKLQLLWIACGKDDSLYKENKELIAALEKKGVKHVWRPTEGAHTWSVWRDYFIEFAPLLFKPAGRTPK
jgi:enterochelin esterase family protein